MMRHKAVIQRPDPTAFDTSFLIKADQFPGWHEKMVDAFSTGGVLKALFNMRSLDTIKDWGEKLKRQCTCWLCQFSCRLRRIWPSLA